MRSFLPLLIIIIVGIGYSGYIAFYANLPSDITAPNSIDWFLILVGFFAAIYSTKPRYRELLKRGKNPSEAKSAAFLMGLTVFLIYGTLIFISKGIITFVLGLWIIGVILIILSLISGR